MVRRDIAASARGSLELVVAPRALAPIVAERVST